MSVFRLQDNTPSVYSSESRDFQILLRAMDALHGGILGDISSMKNLIRPRSLYDSMLSNYASRVGFFTRRSIDSKVFRYILAAFPYIIKNKGTKKGIKQAVATVIKAENNSYDGADIEVEIDNADHIIIIKTTYEVYNKNALEELLKYIIPTGYDYFLSRTLARNVQTERYVDNSRATVVVTTPFSSGARPISAIPDSSEYSEQDSSEYIGNAFESDIKYGDETDIINFEGDIASAYIANIAIPINSVPTPQETAEEDQEQSTEDSDESTT